VTGHRRRLTVGLVVLALVSVAPAWAGDVVSPGEAIRYLGETAKVCGQVASATYAARANGQPTFLNLDKPYPDQEFTALIWGSRRHLFPFAPESLRGETVCVRGVISTYQGKAQIVVSDPSQLERVRDGKKDR
jgi:hypothetical protein